MVGFAATHAQALARRADRPRFHIAPTQGWLNDPNGPLYYKGYYHMFYQHIPEGCAWSFGLVWGHAVSRDLVTWEHMPPAVVPTPGSMDADGAFSGCATLDEHGVPTILYTGVRLRSNDACGPLPPHECDLQLPFIESQCASRPVDPDDPKLTFWTKIEYPWLSLPPPSMGLGGWRDPYILARPGQDGHDCWSLVIGSGVAGVGGTVLLYTSPSLLEGWQLHGELCHGRGSSATTGFVWECPILCRPQLLDRRARLLPSFKSCAHSSAGHASLEQEQPGPLPHFFCVSPDACTNPSLFWLGAYDSSTKRFDLASASGPHRLDLGDVVYAPNTLHDAANDRMLLWCWNQEKRTKVDTYDYAGCLTLPRALSLEHGPSGWQLHQHPIAEMSQLRDPGRRWLLSEELGDGSDADGVVICGGGRLPVPDVEGAFLDMELVVERAEVRDGEEARCSASGLLLHSWSGGAEGSAALLYHWDSGVLEVVFEAMDPATLTFSLAAPGARRVGGRLLRPPPPGSPLQLRVFLDYSCLEVFTAGGEVLTTRVYRGAGVGAGIDIISVDGPSRVLHAAAFEMLPAFGGISADEAAAAAEPLELPLDALVLAAAAVPVHGVATGAAGA